MALIPCSECGKDVSDKAAACPNCGNPIRNSKRTAPSLGQSTKGVVLAKELGQLGTTGKAGFGGGIGAEWVAGHLPNTESKESVLYESTPANAFDNVRIILSNLGKVIDTSPNTDPPFLAAVVSSGFLNMNPALVCLEFHSVEQNKTEIEIMATAKEGWIKQQTAEKIVVRLKKLLEADQ